MLTMWAVTMPGLRSYSLNAWTVRRTRRESIAAWTVMWDRKPYSTWSHWYRQGYRCVRVQVTEIES